MKENLHFELDAYLDDDSGVRVPENEDYKYWPLVADYFLKAATEVEIHCWNDELYATEELTRLMHKQVEEFYTVFSGAVDAELKRLLIESYLNSSGRFKWFSIFMSSDKETIFCSEHWATEFFIPDISEETKLYIERTMPLNNTYHLYTDES